MLRNIIRCTLALKSVPHSELSAEKRTALDKQLLKILGVNEVKGHDEFVVVCDPVGHSDAVVTQDIERIYIAATQVLADFHALSETGRIEMAIREASTHKPVNGMVPSVFRAKRHDNSIHIGFNFQREGTAVGDRFHFDHGAGIHKNKDAEVVWMLQ